MTFGIGPAGTGKTYLAMGAAVQALRAKQVNRLILTRPAVEAGERLGFLPGTLHEKIDPYLKPLWDALMDMMEAEELAAHVERGTIEVAPLAYMRGRTLNDAFIVLDEAQNTTAEQMKMFLTRIGFNSKCVVTGDVSQVDLPSGKKSGLKVVRDILDDIEGVAFAHLSSGDVVRHHIVQRIVEAYESYDLEQEAAEEARRLARARPGGLSRVAVYLADEQDVDVDADDLLALARHVLAAQRVPGDMEVALLLVDAPTIAALNGEHLGKDGPTDVLAFPIDEPGEAPPDTPAILGDVVLCPAVAHEQAAGFGRTPADELRLLTVHGILHLLGMDHADPDEERAMFSLTDDLLASYAAR